MINILKTCLILVFLGCVNVKQTKKKYSENELFLHGGSQKYWECRSNSSNRIRFGWLFRNNYTGEDYTVDYNSGSRISSDFNYSDQVYSENLKAWSFKGDTLTFYMSKFYIISISEEKLVVLDLNDFSGLDDTISFYKSNDQKSDILKITRK